MNVVVILVCPACTAAWSCLGCTSKAPPVHYYLAVSIAWLALSVCCWCAWWGAAAGFSLQMMFDGLKQTIDMYRQAVQAEEMAIADPILHQKFKQVGQIAFRQPA